MGKNNILTYIPDFQPLELVDSFEDFAEYYPFCELQTKRWLVNNSHSDWVYIDAGANIGYYSILMALLSPDGAVHAFEPTSTYKKLLKNLEHNCVKNVIANQIALSNITSTHHAKLWKKYNIEKECREYQFMSIDDYYVDNNLERVNCIKIDVDGLDFEVLQGAEKCIDENKPDIVIEIMEANSARDEVIEYMRLRGYSTVTILDSENYLFRFDDKKGPCVIKYDAKPAEILHGYVAGDKLVSHHLDETGEGNIASSLPKFSYIMSYPLTIPISSTPVFVEAIVKGVKGCAAVTLVLSDSDKIIAPQHLIYDNQEYCSYKFYCDFNGENVSLIFRNMTTSDVEIQVQEISLYRVE